MNAATATAAFAALPAALLAAPSAQPTVGLDVRLAPALPAPPPDLRLLMAALLLLAVALSLVWLAATRLRRRQPPGGGWRQAILNELGRTKARAVCPCRQEVTGSGLPEGQRPCADRVHTLLAEFAAAVTGLPCPSMTTQEMRACEQRLPAAARDAFGRLLDTLDAADLDRFTPGTSQPVSMCLVDAAVATVRNWPAESAAGPTPAGSTGLP